MAALSVRCAARLNGPGARTAAAAPLVPRNGMSTAGLQCRLFQLTKPLVAAFPGCNAARAPLRRAACSAAAGDAASGGTGSPAPSQQFSLLRIAGDGNCLFRSLAQGGHVAAQEDAAAAGSGCLAPQLLSAEQETAAAGELRAAICQELLNRREELCFFIDGDYASYVARMRQPHIWGGEPELAVATHVLHRPITVYMLRHTGLQQISCYGDGQHGSAADLPLLFHGAGHYDLLLRQPPSDAPRSRL